MSDQHNQKTVHEYLSSGELMPGLGLETDLTPEVMMQNIEATLAAFSQQVENDLENFTGVDIIIPFDGGLVAMREFKRISPSLAARVNFIFAAKDPNLKGAYILSSAVRTGTKRYILDDIYDRGDSSVAIRVSAGTNDIDAVALSSKEGKSYNQPGIPLHIYSRGTDGKDKWVASGFGMNDGKFGSYALEMAVEDGLISGYDLDLLLMHEEIEIWQRICGVSFILNSEDELNSWRFNLAACHAFLFQLWNSTMYRDPEERASIVSTLRALQKVKGADKFSVMQASV